MAARRSLTWLFEVMNARMRRAAPMTAKSKEKKRAMRVRRAMVVGVPVGGLAGAPCMCATLMYVGGWKYPKKSSVGLFGRIVDHRTICNAGTAINVCDVNLRWPHLGTPPEAK